MSEEYFDQLDRWEAMQKPSLGKSRFPVTDAVARLESENAELKQILRAVMGVVDTNYCAFRDCTPITDIRRIRQFAEFQTARELLKRTDGA